ncbi:MAG: SPOR domain-containing protein [Candidatus Paracaedibacteraceae bacterium]|nr:SPOR domain-containing protein [Candidatus Paracaedibacteraceae bacterium]
MTPFFRKLQESEDRAEQKLGVGSDQETISPSHPVPQDIRFGEVRATFGQVDRDDQIHRLRFMRDHDRDSESQDTDWEDRQSPLNFIILTSLLIILVVLGWFGYRWFNHSYNDAPPILMADESPYKVRPENPGGLTIPHQDKLIYGRIAPHAPQMPERLLPQPEQPILPEQGYGPPMYGPQQGGYIPQEQNQMRPQYAPEHPGAYYGQPAPQSTHHGQPVYIPAPGGMMPSVPPSPAYQQEQFAPNPSPQEQVYAPHSVPPYHSQQPLQPMAHPQARDSQYEQHMLHHNHQYGGPSHQQALPQQSLSSAGIAQQPDVTNPRGSFEHSQQREASSAEIDPLDELVSSEATLVEKTGSTKLKLASLNNDSPFAAEPSNQKQLKKENPKVLPVEGAYRVQLGSFVSEKEAKTEVRRLKNLDNTIFSGKKFIIQKSTSSVTGNSVYKLMVGFFSTANTATTFKNKMKIHRVDGIVVKSAA